MGHDTKMNLTNIMWGWIEMLLLRLSKKIHLCCVIILAIPSNIILTEIYITPQKIVINCWIME